MTPKISTERTADIDYVGTSTMTEWMDAVTEVFENYDCEILAVGDTPTVESWYARLSTAQSVIMRFLQGWWPMTDGRWIRGSEHEPITDEEAATIAAARRQNED